VHSFVAESMEANLDTKDGDSGMIKDAKDLNLPFEAKWYWKQADMLLAWSEQGGCPTARDRPYNDRVVKVYGLFSSSKAFLDCLRRLSSVERCMYELIPEDSLCRAHADIEWIGDPSEGHRRILMVLEALRQKIRVDFPHQTAEVYVLCGSRELKNKEFKHSYHVIVGNMFFPSNHDGDMEEFFKSVCVGSDFFYEHQGKRKCIVDPSIYSRNRCFRAPYCTKFGENAPLIRISADPGDDVIVDDYKELSAAEDDDLLRMLVSLPGKPDGDTILVGDRKYAEKKRKRRSDHEEERAPPALRTHLQTALTDLLRLCGDQNTAVSSTKALPDGTTQVQCRNVGDRSCLCVPGMIHQNNNCLLHLTPQSGEGCFKVTYTCMSERRHAGTCRLATIGYIVRDPGADSFRAALRLESPCTHTRDWCIREILLTSDMDLSTQEALLLFSSCKTVDPAEGVPEVLIEWCSRSLSFDAANIHRLWTRAQGDVVDPLRSLHKLRLDHPAIVLWSHDVPTSDDKIRHVLRSINTSHVSWPCLTRIMKQVYPSHRDDVLKFVQDVYGVERAVALPVWDRGTFPSQHLIDHLDLLVCQDKLLTESLPLVMGAPLVKYQRRDSDTLDFWLDEPPFDKAHVLYLDSGRVDGSLNLKHFSAISSPYADASLAEALVAVGISNKLRYDSEEQVFRSYEASSGKWKKQDGGDDRAWALALIMREITVWLKMANHVQTYHEEKSSESLKNLQKLQAKYGEGARAAEEVLKLLRPRITFKFKTPKHLLCFSNGLVDLKTGALLGPAKPEDCVKHSIPHPYDPSVDFSEFEGIMQSFFPAACYGDDSEPIVEFLQRWQGYRLTGETSVQKALWLTGRGSNGKSVLSNLNVAAFGPEIHHSLSMEAFQQVGIGNNDDLFAAIHARCVDIMENTDNRMINEKLFKSVTGGDSVQVAAKYKTGIKVEQQMKFSFYNNDCPIWSSPDCFALNRRCLNLPMRAQFLDADRDTAEWARLSEAGHESWIFERNGLLEDELKARHIPAFLKWCVEGSVKFYQNGLMEPMTIKKASREEQQDKCQLLEFFVEEYIEKCHDFGNALQNDISLSTEEIREIFLRKEGFEQSILDKKTEDALNQKLKKILTGPDEAIFPGVKSKTLKRYPTRKGPKNVKGYYGIRWKKGEISQFVDEWKQQFVSMKGALPALELSRDPC